MEGREREGGKKLAQEIMCWNKMDEVRIPFRFILGWGFFFVIFFFFYIKTFLLTLHSFPPLQVVKPLNKAVPSPSDNSCISVHFV